MTLSLVPLELPDELRKIILSGNCVAFLGSGLSAGSYHPWPDLVNALCRRCGSPCSVTRDTPGEAFLDAAQDAKNANRQEYLSFLGEHFGRPAPNASFLYDAVLALPFQSYLTVNLDPLLALKARTAPSKCRTPVCAYPSLDRKEMGNRSIHYLHGFINERAIPPDGTIVLARGEFEEAYGDNSNLMTFLLPTLANEPIVFFGCRLQEPVMARLFDICKQHQQKRLKTMAELGRSAGNLPSRFIFLGRPEVKDSCGKLNDDLSKAAVEKQEDFYTRMDIRPVWYPAPEEDHSALRYALERLAELPDIGPNYGWEGSSYVR